MSPKEELCQRVRKLLARRQGISEKRLFASAGFLLHGHMLVGVHADSLLLRVGEEESELALREPAVSPFEIRGRGPMRGWIVVGLPAIQEEAQLKTWLQRALRFVATLPPRESGAA
jgi:TfoX/Sxy family transcriptional regulator of competence genes